MYLYDMYFHWNKNTNASHASELISICFDKTAQGIFEHYMNRLYVEARLIDVIVETENHHYYKHPAEITAVFT